MLDCRAAMTVDSFGISRIPASPSGRTMCAIEVQMNMAMPPRMPAIKILMSESMRDAGWKRKGENEAPTARLSANCYQLFGKAEGSGQRTEDRGQKTEKGRRRTEDRK